MQRRRDLGGVFCSGTRLAPVILQRQWRRFPMAMLMVQSRASCRWCSFSGETCGGRRRREEDLVRKTEQQWWGWWRCNRGCLRHCGTRWFDVALAPGLVAFLGSCVEEKKPVHDLGLRKEDKQCRVREFGTLNKVYGLDSINNQGIKSYRPRSYSTRGQSLYYQW